MKARFWNLYDKRRAVCVCLRERTQLRMRVWSTKPDGVKRLRMRAQNVKHEGAKRPSSLTGLAWRDKKWLARLVIFKTFSLITKEYCNKVAWPTYHFNWLKNGFICNLKVHRYKSDTDWKFWKHVDMTLNFDPQDNF